MIDYPPQISPSVGNLPDYFSRQGMVPGATGVGLPPGATPPAWGPQGAAIGTASGTPTPEPPSPRGKKKKQPGDMPMLSGGGQGSPFQNAFPSPAPIYQTQMENMPSPFVPSQWSPMGSVLPPQTYNAMSQMHGTGGGAGPGLPDSLLQALALQQSRY